MNHKCFGTDGIRGKVGQEPITPLFFLKLGMAAGKVFSTSGINRVIIGKDTRISGYMFESALEAGFSSVGMDVFLVGPMPTPAVAYLTQTFNANLGVVISASHNPYDDNGIKFFTNKGTKISHEKQLEIDSMLQKNMSIVDSCNLGKVKRINDAAGRYIEYCKASVQPSFDLSGMHIIVDAANGATYQIGPDVFKELGAKVTVISNQPDGFNINHKCGSTYINPLKNEVIKRKADLGIAFDGDGDRVLLVDELGNIVDGDEILYIIAAHHARKKTLHGGVVGTVMSNLGMEKALAEIKVPFIRSKVGDRHVYEALSAKEWMLGGESSGHIICRHVSTTGDGIVGSLQVISAIMDTGKSLSELKFGMTKYPQKIINVPISQAKNIIGNDIVASAVLSAEKQMGKKGRVLLRPSGTEPVIRVMVEGENLNQVNIQAQYLAKIVAEVAD